MAQGLLTYKALAEHYGVTTRTMYQRVWRGNAPTPVLGPTGRVLGWRPEEVARYDGANQRTRTEYLYGSGK